MILSMRLAMILNSVFIFLTLEIFYFLSIKNIF